MAKILTINPGSTSYKYKFFAEDELQLDLRFTEADGNYIEFNAIKNLQTKIAAYEFNQSIGKVYKYIHEELKQNIDKVGIRIVHNGGKYMGPKLLDDKVLEDLQNIGSLAPLHNKYALDTARKLSEIDPKMRIYGVFDTDFYYSLPEKAYLYALPYSAYRDFNVRRLGFHGISHEYMVTEVLANAKFSNFVTKIVDLFTRAEHKGLRILSCHLGGGCSITASVGGKAIDTSMGMTPLEGLVMGTRSGDVDFGAVAYWAEKTNKDLQSVFSELNHNSGILGLSETTEDMKKLLEMYRGKDPAAKRALDVFVYRIQKYIGAYMASMNGLDAIVFSGAIGSGSGFVRELICASLSSFGIRLNNRENYVCDTSDLKQIRKISKGAVGVYVISADEEKMIATKLRSV